MASPVPDSPHVRFGPYELDPSAGRLLKEGIPLKLQPQPFRILLLLTSRPGQVVTREEIRRHLWGDSTFVDFERGINFSINQIRTVLCDDAEKPRYIETLPRVGYRFIPPVAGDGLRKPAGPAAPFAHVYDWPRIPEEIIHPSIPSEGVSSPASRPLPEPWWRHRKLPAAAIVSAVLLIVAGLGARRLLRPGHAGPNNVQISKLTQGQSVTDVAISPDGRYAVYGVLEKGGQALWLRQVATGSGVRILPAGPEFHGLTFSPDGNYIYVVRSDDKDPQFKYLYLMPTLGGTVRKLITDLDSPVSFSPDGKRFVYERCIPPRNDIELKMANADGSDDHVLALLHDGSNFLFQPGPSWSPDGQTIAVPVLLRSQQSRWVVDIVSTANGNVQEFYAPPGSVGRPAWLSGGQSLLLQHYDPLLHRHQLWTISFPRGAARPVTQDLMDYGMQLDITRDRGTAIAIASKTAAHVWVAPATDLSQAHQITFDEIPLFFVSEALDGKLLAGGGDRFLTGGGGGRLWIMNSDGSQRTQFTDTQNAGWLTSCGRFVVFTSNQTETVNLMRVDRDGTHSTNLASGNIWAPVCSPDGEFVFYESVEQPQKIWKVRVEGGAPVKVDDVLADQVDDIAISPDGKFLAYMYAQYGHVPSYGWSVAVIPTSGGRPVKNLKVSEEIGCLHWSPDGKSLQYLLTRDGADNVWEQPLAGGQARELTRFTSGRIFDFNWSADHTQLLLARGSVSSDAVLISDLQ